MSTPEYAAWQTDPTPENLAKVVNSMDPVINSEIHRYSGPKPLLRSRAKLLTINAVKTFKPEKGAHLRSWVVTQLQPLSRYGQQLRPVHASEMAIRQAAELNRIEKEYGDKYGHNPTLQELSDEVGIPVARINKIRKQVKPTVSESTFMESDDEEGKALPGTMGSDVLGTAEEIVYDSLSPRDRAIYDLKTGRHGKAMVSNQEIAKRLGVTPALISQRSQQIAVQIGDLAQKKGL